MSKKIMVWSLILAFGAMASVGCTNAQKKPLPQNQNQQMAPNQAPNQNDNFGGKDQDMPLVPDNPNRGIDEKDIPGDLDKDNR